MMILSFSMRRDFDGEVYFGRSLTVSARFEMAIRHKLDPGADVKVGIFLKTKETHRKNITTTAQK